MLVYIKDIEKVIRDLPDDREEALIAFHDRIAEKTIAKNHQASQYQRIDSNKSYLLYMSNFIRYRNYDVDIARDIEQISNEDLVINKAKVDELLNIYRNNVTLKKITSSMAIALSAEPQYFDGVILHQSTKSQIRQYINKIKETIEASELSDSKKEALLGKMNDFLVELDKERTRLDALADFYVFFKREAAEGVAWAIDNAERIEKIWTSLTKGKQSLPAPERGGELEAPKKQLPAPGEEVDEDAAA